MIKPAPGTHPWWCSAEMFCDAELGGGHRSEPVEVDFTGLSGIIVRTPRVFAYLYQDVTNVWGTTFLRFTDGDPAAVDQPFLTLPLDSGRTIGEQLRPLITPSAGPVREYLDRNDSGPAVADPLPPYVQSVSWPANRAHRVLS